MMKFNDHVMHSYLESNGCAMKDNRCFVFYKRDKKKKQIEFECIALFYSYTIHGSRSISR